MLPFSLKKIAFLTTILFYFTFGLTFFNRTLKYKSESLLNPHNYDYLLNAGDRVCGKNSGENVTLLAFVPISAAHFKQRYIIRSTWGSNNFYPDKFKVVFMLGDSNNASINQKIREESNTHHDIVQENFMDTYRNLTLKTIMGMKWASNYCSGAKFILKIDDDMTPNPFKLVRYLEEILKAKPKIENTLMCRVHEKTYVDRRNGSKFKVSIDEFAPTLYHTYCDGAAYLLTNDLARKFYEQSVKTKSFVFEDVYIGLLAKALNSTFKDIPKEYSVWHYLYLEDVLEAEPESFDNYLFIRTNDRSNIIHIWKNIILRFLSKSF